MKVDQVNPASGNVSHSIRANVDCHSNGENYSQKQKSDSLSLSAVTEQ
jgi:hypothetical protein